MRKKQFSYFSFENFFGFWAKIFSDFRRKIFKKLSKLPSTCPEDQFVAWIFFLKFWIVLDFLHKPSAWFSKFYLHVKNKNCGRNSFLIFCFQNFFRILSENFFRLSAKNLQKVVKTTFCVSREQFVAWNIFWKFWIVLDFLQKPLAWFSNFYLRVQCKNCGRNSFLIYFSEFFRILSEKFFRLSAKKLQKVVKTTFYVSRGTICGLNFY